MGYKPEGKRREREENRKGRKKDTRFFLGQNSI